MNTPHKTWESPLRAPTVSFWNDTYNMLKSAIPPDLWDRYKHLSFGEMAEQPELIDYAEMLGKAAQDWYETEREDPTP